MAQEPPPPVAPAGIPGDCTVQTARGPRRLASLEAGARLITRAGMRRLLALAPASPAARSVVIDAHAFAPGLPDAPLRLHPAQVLRLPDGAGGGLWRAGALIDGISIRVAQGAGGGPLHPLLDGPGDLYAAGLYLCVEPAAAEPA